jgi:hypothetical protein
MDFARWTVEKLEVEVAKFLSPGQDEYGKWCYTIQPTHMVYRVYIGDNVHGSVWMRFARDANAFEDVKREIERREWEWACEFRLPEHNHEFTVFNEHFDAYIGVDDSEFRAGCIAFLRACEVAEQEEKDG